MKPFVSLPKPITTLKIASVKPCRSVNLAQTYNSTQLFRSHKLITQVANVNVIANDLKRGEVILLRDKLLQIKSKAESSAGRRDTYIQLELQDIKTGKKYQERLRSQQDVEEIDMVHLTFSKINEDGALVFQNDMSEEVTFPGEGSVFTEFHKAYLQEGADVTVKMFEDSPIDVILPDKVELEVVSLTNTGADRASGGASTIAKLSNGRTIKVPRHVKEGDKIVVKTEDESFLTKA